MENILVPRPGYTGHMVRKVVGDQPIGLAIYTLFKLMVKEAVFCWLNGQDCKIWVRNGTICYSKEYKRLQSSLHMTDN